LPSVDRLAETFGAWGIDETIQVVAYDQGPGAYASRLWWMLRYLGHDAVAVLDGGFAMWRAEGQPVRSGAEQQTRRSFSPRVRPGMLVTAVDVGHHLHDGQLLLIDARAPERYRGDVEPLDPVAGHIPGAVNAFYQDNLSADGTFRPVADLRARFAERLSGTPADRTVVYCGSGVTACHDLLALEHAGLQGARLYAGSWSEWIADPTRPVGRGDER
jgi:thiosulfate/3-mercaptopyruvate sulfurtransferase